MKQKALAKVATSCSIHDMATWCSYGTNMQGNSKLAPSPVRMPHTLKHWLKQRAKDNHRSMNSEIVVRLEESCKAEADAPKSDPP